MQANSLREQFRQVLPALEHFAGKSEFGLVQVPVGLLQGLLDVLDKAQDKYIFVSKERLISMMQFETTDVTIGKEDFPMYLVRLHLVNQHIDKERLIGTPEFPFEAFKDRLIDYTLATLEKDPENK